MKTSPFPGFLTGAPTPRSAADGMQNCSAAARAAPEIVSCVLQNCKNWCSHQSMSRQNKDKKES